MDRSAWPLSVEEVWVRCEQGRAVVAETADGKVYAANGLAKGQGRYRDIEEIWLDDPNVDGLKINLDPVTRVGVAICDGDLPPS